MTEKKKEREREREISRERGNEKWDRVDKKIGGGCNNAAVVRETSLSHC